MSSHPAGSQNGDGGIGVHAHVSKEYPIRSPSNASGSSAAPLSPMMSSSEFLQSLHVQMSPSRLEPGKVTSSPEKQENHFVTALRAGQQPWAMRLPLPLPGEHAPTLGGMYDVDC
jgi:hypothetical protein